MKLLIGILCGILLLISSLTAAITVTSNTTDPDSDWNAVPLIGSNVSDYLDDDQAQSAELDLIGTTGYSAFYTGYDDLGTAGDTTDDLVGFRYRISGDKLENGDIGTNIQYWAGLDVDGDGALDIFVGTSNSLVSLHDAGTGANTSPSTTTIEPTPIWSTGATGTNLGFAEVTSIDTGAIADIDSGPQSLPDMFVTVIVPYDELASAAETYSTLGAGEFSLATPISYVAATATNVNTLNSDINGTDGNINSSDTWATLGAISQELSVTGAPIPEPALVALILGLACFGYVLYRRRRK